MEDSSSQQTNNEQTTTSNGRPPHTTMHQHLSPPICGGIGSHAYDSSLVFDSRNQLPKDENGDIIYDGLDESYRSVHDNVTETEAMLEASQRSQLSEPLHPQTNMESMMNLIKGMVGTGILAMPSAFKSSGLWVGFITLALIGILATHCMHMLLRCSHALCRRLKTRSLSYGEVAEEAFLGGPQCLRPFAHFSLALINVFLCITQFGFCIVYILFVSQTAKQIFDECTSLDLSIQIYMLIMVLFLMPFMLIKNLKHLAPFCMLANVLVAGGLVIILIHCFFNLPPNTDYYPPSFAGWTSLPIYFGIALYAFEGIGVVLPIENRMQRPGDFGGMNGVLTTGMTLVVCLYLAVGWFGYLVYQDNVLGSITLNLPTNTWLFIGVKAAFGAAIFITYALQFYVPIQILWPLVWVRLPSDSWIKGNGEIILRIAFVLATYAIAAVIPHLNLMISLVGAFSSSALALIFPPIIELVTFWNEEGAMTKTTIIKDIFISVFGFVGFILGTVSSISEIIRVFT